MSDDKNQNAEASTSFKTFLESVPPGRSVSVHSLDGPSLNNITFALRLPTIELYCPTEACNGIRFFEPLEHPTCHYDSGNRVFVVYECRNCKASQRVYALGISKELFGSDGWALKFGEDPPFGPPTPARVIALVGPDKEFFLKGRRAENQGMGIAAFAYYRRVIENQKNRIIDEIIKVSKKLGADPGLIADLEKAKAETQFTRAVDSVKHGIPQSLLIDGHNPLVLLHSALSEGLHAQTDEECLELATHIRVVLADLAERLSAALKDHAELNSAVSRLMQRATPKS